MGTDVGIVGGSFAGLACAQALRRRGVGVTVYDRKRDPGAAIHTTGILVREVADAWPVPRRFTRRIAGVRLYSPALRSIDLESPGYHFLATDTPNLMRWWTAEAGVPVRRGFEFRRRGDVKARFIVGADGPGSKVARAYGLGVNRSFLIGVEAEFSGVRGLDEDHLHCFLDSRLARGYIGWVVPGVGVTQVGLACRPPAKPDLQEFISRVGRLFDFDRARIVGRRGGRIPVGGPVRPISAPGVLLVGDAAGLVSPLTAGGIHTALHYGALAGEAIADHLGGGPEPVVPVPLFAFKRLMRMAADLGPPNRLIDAGLSSPPLRALARVIFFHHRGLFSPEAWRDIAVVLASI